MPTKERLVIEHMLRIADKEGNDVDFVLNSAQRTVDNRLTGRDVIPKARQEGVSSYFLARNLVKCLHKRNTRAVVIAHEKDATKKMLSKVHYMLKHIKGPKAVLGKESTNEISFPKTGSAYYIGTAGAKEFGRGDTITDLHCSEVAFWKNPKKLLGGLFQAVPRTGEISLESTGNGTGNYFHRLCMRANAGNSRYRLHFLPWQDFPEYHVPLTDAKKARLLNNLSEEWEETQLVRRGFTLEQLAFRREKLEELEFDLQLFKQEYPETLDECFQATGFSIFNNVTYENDSLWQDRGNHMHVYGEHPRRDYQYAIGADVGAGIGKDYSVGEVWCLTTEEQVGEYRNNRIDPKAFGKKLKLIGHEFNDAYITVENNNHGILTVDTLMGIYPPMLLHRKSSGGRRREKVDKITDVGFRTTVKSKPFAIGELRGLLSAGWVIHSPVLKDELDTFIENEEGKLEAEEGCFDDTVMACAAFAATLDKATLATMPRIQVVSNTQKDPMSLDHIINEMRGRGHDGLISLQV